ncbi:tRNA intron endonuclease [Dioszegia hungarica]|uniref:tRNA intron endonuclease n=1 Tax=Dioszegia hungarica TaxID=4972 RepID=A0AA38HE12_9TREE|nr:tRNA intron endonuclease [Dioszegia hungarica]KAI9638766.1 tRNA intron endonuclease [Dioszegia hungarica]
MVPTDPLRTLLLPVLEACPLQAGSLYTSYKDLSLSVEWHDLRAFVLPGTEWAVILGHKKRQDPLRVVLPLPLHTTALKPSILKLIYSTLASLPFSAIPVPDDPLVPSIEEVQREMASRRVTSGDAETGEGSTEKEKDNGQEAAEVNESIDRETIYLAIVTSDSTVVYYKLSKGIKKPADIPDE